jgi:hypothetical protein
LLFAVERAAARLGPPAATEEVTESVASEMTDEEILFREALAAGLDRRDPLVKQRLERLGAMVTAGEVEDAAHLEEEARRLGLDRRDLVVRRYLVQAMMLAFSHPGPDDFPDEAEIAAHYERNRERYAAPARVRFRHVYFARDRKGLAPAEAAIEARTRLAGTDPSAGDARRRLDTAGTDEATVSGDPFLLGSRFDLAESAVAHDFGPQFAAALAQAPAGRWAGPIESSYGSHLVWIEERRASTVPDLEAVRSQVRQDLLAEQARSRLERRLAERRAYWEGRG